MQRYITVLFLAGALFAPAVGSAQDRVDQRGDRNGQNQRFYDSRHRDWHQWNDNENRAYRQYLEERHRPYRDFNRASKREQNAYFNWRHEHGDTAERK